MRKALATLGVVAVLLFAGAVMTGCGEKSDDESGNGNGESETPETPSGD